MVQSHAEQHQLALGEFDQVGGVRLTDQTNDGVGCLLFGVDELIDAEFLGSKNKIGCSEFGIARRNR